MTDTAEDLLTTISPATCVCFDAEFARGMEMLELSAVDLCGNLIYSQRFKPRRYRTWDTEIHHITPEMVAAAPSFSSCRKRIQAIVDRCSYVVGFAVRENDLSKMKRQYVHGLDSKHVVELRDWFWICHGLDNSLDYVQGISLRFCCEQLGVDHDERHAHASAYDAAVTLKCFKILFRRFVERYGHNRGYASFGDVLTHFASVFRKHKHEYDVERAAGYCAIVNPAPGDYLLKATRERPDDENMVECIAVADRKKAMLKLGEHFLGEPRRRSFFFHKLTDRNMAYFRSLAQKSAEAE